MYGRGGLLIGLCLMATLAFGHGIEATLSDKTANVAGDADLAVTDYGRTQFRLRGFFNEAGDVMGSMGVYARGMPAGRSPFFAIVGLWGYIGHLDDLRQGIHALSLGAGAGVTIARNMPVTVEGSVYYAPDITSFNDTANLVEGDARVALEIMPGTSGFVGYRYLRVELADDNPELLDHRPHLGIRIAF